ncbi:MAG: hypothetical protein ACTHJ0_02885 [Flavipsychrobacter sp.]
MDFDKDFYWHDSILERIMIDRTDPGNSDTIVLEIDWYDEGPGRLIFEEVRLAKFSLNMGIIALETMDKGYTVDNDPDLLNYYARWKGLFDDVKLNTYVIKTLSTGGEIKIIAESFRSESK